MLDIDFALRQKHDLNGKWLMVPDPMKRATAQKWWLGPRKSDSYFPSWDIDGLWETEVPSVWNLKHPELRYYEGDAIYYKTFTYVKPDKQKRTFLYFEGVADYCKVFLNGTLVGEHYGGWTPFTIEITHQVSENNILFLIVRTIRNDETIPSTIHDWEHHSGIHRPVSVYTLPELFISQVQTQTLIECDTVNVSLGIKISSIKNKASGNASISISDNLGNIIKKQDARLYQLPERYNYFNLNFKKHEITLWSPGNPQLYKVEITLDNGDTWSEQIGFRQLEIDGNKILLNKKELLLLGVGQLSEDPLTGYSMQNNDYMEKVIQRLKELNVNFVRAGWYPRGSEMLRRFDREGILLWLEIGVYWNTNASKPAPTGLAMQGLTEMITQHRNRASAIIWSVGNECIYHNSQTGESNLSYFLKASQHCKKEDPTRLVSYAGGIEGIGDMIDEISFPTQFQESVDIVGINNYAGISKGSSVSENINCILKAKQIGKPIIITEVGVDAIIGLKAETYDDNWQGEFLGNLIKEYHRLMKNGELNGVAVYVLHDYKSPIKWSKCQFGYNRKGLLTNDLAKEKTGFNVVKELYRKIIKEFHIETSK